METTEYLRKTAQRCFALSERCYHLEVARELRRLGDDLNAEAAENGLSRRSGNKALAASERIRVGRSASSRPDDPRQATSHNPIIEHLFKLAAHFHAVMKADGNWRSALARWGF